MTNTDRAFLFEQTRKTLEQHGWSANADGNTLTSPDIEHAKIVLSYSGGYIHLRGQIERNGTITEFWDQGNTLSKVIGMARDVDMALRNGDSEWSTEP